MTPLITCQEISKSHGSRELFSGLCGSLFSGDRVGLIGPNGAGKSTLLKLLAGVELPDSGEITKVRGLRVGYVPQHIEEAYGSVFDVVLNEVKRIDTIEEYDRETVVRKIVGTLGFPDPAQSVKSLSGGWQRRLSLAKALVSEPDVLLLDEPTNHLDLDGILWLEEFLQRRGITFITTSHDRVFLDRISTRIWEISHAYPGGLFAVDGAYGEFLDRRETFLLGQAQMERSMRSKVRREEEWLKQNPKARTTKSRSRIEEAARLQKEFALLKRRNAVSKATLGLSDTGRHTRKLLAAKNLSKGYGGADSPKLFAGIDLTLARGDRIGIVGENGSGKSTLLRLLAKELDSDTGTIKYADDLQIFLFDQHREKLDLSLTLREALTDGKDNVYFRGSKIHVSSWAERFLFPRERLELPLSQFSGGEKARVLIARLMLRPADLLLLDEPSNDLDIETLELLEDSLDDFPGAVVLVSHDRAMMDRITDKVICVGEGANGREFNDSESWLAWRKELRAAEPKKEKVVVAAPKAASGVKRLSYNEQQEFAGMEGKIMSLEEGIESILAQTNDPSNHRDGPKMALLYEKLGTLKATLDAAYLRWEALEARK